ncbi:MAG: hypothetical protein KAS12_01820 [Candidatus Aenigmarchaeota archaeon]|nr:hypothetical protein [Candidatus Aenigmarchaeota archaeon]
MPIDREAKMPIDREAKMPIDREAKMPIDEEANFLLIKYFFYSHNSCLRNASLIIK